MLSVIDGWETTTFPCERLGFCPGQEGEVRSYYYHYGFDIEKSNKPGMLRVRMVNENSEHLICVEVPVKVEDRNSTSGPVVEK